LINYHLKTDENFPYWFALYLTLEMLNIVDYLHRCQIIHADIKPDNLMINKLPDSLQYFDPSRTKCLVLIDFNRSIDLSMLPSEAEFDAKASNKSLLCCEMKSDKSWKYQIDYYGILSSIHCVIFKKYMKTFSEGGRNKITNNIPRQYDKVFAELFDTYLNIPSCTEIPDLQTEWITKFVGLFKAELGSSFSKYKKYLKDLNEAFNQ
jgi:checkpoint serine/threonine-protein kinase